MRITELFKPQSPTDTVKPLSPEERGPAERRLTEEQVQGGADQVSISPLARQFAQISRLLAEDEQSGQTRLAELKKQVEGGTYSVSGVDVARAITSFTRDSE